MLDSGGEGPGFDEDWQFGVLEDHLLLSEYGDDLRHLPSRMRRAHLAILAGQHERRRESNEEAEREAKKARRKASSGRYT